MHKTMSQKQLDANRRNARKSTGPKTEAGKQASRFNALQHGLLSEDIVVRGWRGGESASEFEALQQEFLQQYAPVGPLEKLLVRRIVILAWRLNRPVRAEAGEIALSVEGGHWLRQQPERMQDRLLAAAFHDDPALTLQTFTSGLQVLLGKLQFVRAAVEQDGELTEATLQITHCAGKSNDITEQLAALRDMPIENTEGLDEAARKNKRRDKILAAIDELKEKYFSKAEATIEHESNEESARLAAAALPDFKTVDKLLRYETTLERQFYRAMHELARLQRERQGEDHAAAV